MEYKDLQDKVRVRFDIVEGELVESPSGLFIVSKTYQPYSIYLNAHQETFTVIAPEKSYIGRKYRLRISDCITLFAEWLDDNTGSAFGNIYQNLTNKEFYKYYCSGMCYWYLDNGFTEKQVYEHGDVLVYAHAKGIISHVGICIDGDKILHHIPNKYSCLDLIVPEKVIGVFKNAY